MTDVWFNNEGGKEIDKTNPIERKSGSFQLYIINIHYHVIEEKEVDKDAYGKTILKKHRKTVFNIIEDGVLRNHSYADREFPLDKTIQSIKPTDDEKLIEIVFGAIKRDETQKIKVKILKIERLEKRGLTAY